MVTKTDSCFSLKFGSFRLPYNFVLGSLIHAPPAARETNRTPYIASTPAPGCTRFFPFPQIALLLRRSERRRADKGRAGNLSYVCFLGPSGSETQFFPLLIDRLKAVLSEKMRRGIGKVESFKTCRDVLSTQRKTYRGNACFWNGLKRNSFESCELYDSPE